MTGATGKKRWPLPKRFQVALSEPAYRRLRDLNAAYGFSNNYLLTILLENLDEVCHHKKLDAVFHHMIAEYGQNAPQAAPGKTASQDEEQGRS
ncbi:MAG: hypothetical protein AAGE61_20065 [Pseudomonadota bacterium]